jgi:hypothetical protein
MRRLNALGVGAVVLVGLFGAVPAASAGGPPEGRVTIVGPIVDEIACDGASITRTGSGWVGIPAAVDGLPTFYHLTWVYSNAAGDTWSYIDTGLIRAFERDGVLYFSLSGRSTDVGPDGTGWVGHWELNTSTNEVSRVGLGVGYVDQLACSALGFS